MKAASDEMGRDWVATYDDRGNMLTRSVDPCGLDLTQSWTYNGENNVTGYTDGAGNTVTFHYDDPSFATLLTSIIEPAVGDCQQDPLACPATTTLQYYASGLLEQVTDPNGVVTKFDYDQWGQPKVYSEGEVNGAPIYLKLLTHDSGSRLVQTDTCKVTARQRYNAGNLPIGLGTTAGAENPCAPKLLATAAGSGGPAGFPNPPCSLPAWPDTTGWLNAAQYTPRGEPLSMSFDALQGTGGWTRTFTRQFDPLGRVTAAAVSSDEVFGLYRPFSYSYDTAGGTLVRTGPDGTQTYVEFDAGDRLSHLERYKPGEMAFMVADHTYHANGLVESVTFGNGASTWYAYDEANRLTLIDHRDGTGTIMSLTYTYTANSLPDAITEADAVSTLAVVDFDYDARGRLIAESRSGTDPYDLSYTYDQGGNRLGKIDAVNDREVVYHYDIEDPATYLSANNRLEYYEEFDTSSGGHALVATSYYYYNCINNPEVILTHDAVADTYSGVRFKYAMNGSTVTHALGETWTYTGDPVSTCPDRMVTFAREFRYDGARARYLDRELDPAYAQTGALVALSDLWTDYDGDEPHGDFTFDGTLANVRSFELGIGRAAWSKGLPQPADYYYTDHLGTSRLLTDPNGLPVNDRAFTAFGEAVTGSVSQPEDRYGYVGAWGYQAHLNPTNFPYVHLGARYYDASTARFLQRDPIGIRGGTNVYAYVFNVPTIMSDPSGLGFWDGDNPFHNWIACHFWGRIHSQQTLANMSDARATAEAVGISVAGGVAAGAATSATAVQAARGAAQAGARAAMRATLRLRLRFGSPKPGPAPPPFPPTVQTPPVPPVRPIGPGPGRLTPPIGRPPTGPGVPPGSSLN